MRDAGEQQVDQRRVVGQCFDGGGARSGGDGSGLGLGFRPRWVVD
jgi:hypothetical protein